MRVRVLPFIPFYLMREAVAPPRERKLEPMVMEDPRAVEQFHKISGVNFVPLYQMCALAMSHLIPAGGTVLDLGCGSGQYLAHLARRRPDLRIVGLDLSEPMLRTGREMLAREGLDDRVELRRGDMTDFLGLVPEQVDAISTVRALHHLPSSEVLTRCLEQVASVRESTGCAVWIYDRARFKHPKSLRAFMSTLTITPLPPVLRGEALASDGAAFTYADLTQACEDAGLGTLHHRRLRLWRNFQAHWAPRLDGAPHGHDRWRDVPLPEDRRLDTQIMLRLFPGIPTR